MTKARYEAGAQTMTQKLHVSRAALIAGGVMVVAVIAAVQPAAALAGGIVLLLVGCYALDPRAALLPMFLWILFQNTLVSMLEARGLAEVTTWLRRSDEVLFLLFVVVAALQRAYLVGRVNSYGVALPVGAMLVVAVVNGLYVGHAPAFVSALDLVLLLKGAWVFLVAAHAADDNRPVGRWTWFAPVLVVGTFALAVAAVEIVNPLSFRAFVGLPTIVYMRGDWSSLAGPFTHPGVFGWYMAVCAILCIALVVDGDRRGWIGIVPFMIAILASGRRKPLAGVVVATIVLVWASSPGKIRWRRMTWAILGLGGFLLAFSPFVADLIRETLQNYISIQNPLAQARDVLYLASVMLAVRHFPLGAGPGLFGGYAARLYYSPLYTQLGIDHVWGLTPANPIFLDDTFWPHVLGEFGLLGLVAYLFLLYRTSRGAVSAARDPSAAAPLLSRVAVALLAEAVVESVASAAFEQSLQAFVIFGALGLAAGAAVAARQSSGGTAVGLSM